MLELEFLINQYKTTREIAIILKTSQTNVRYWLNKFELKTKLKNLEKRPNENSRVCPMCKIEKELKFFYQKRGKAGNSTYCKPCTIEKTIIRQQKFKLDCIEYKGSKCQLCGYNKYQGALEFHHIDPNEKDFNISKARLLSFNSEIKKELDKCVLLCANCHREVHNDLYLLNTLSIEL